MRPLSPNYAVNSSQDSHRLLCADRPSLGCRWVPSSHRRLLRPANRCCTDFGSLQRVLSLAGGASETVGACGNSPAGGGGGGSSLWEFCLTAQLPPICTSPPGALDLTQLKPGVGCRAPPGWQQLSILIRWRWFQEPHRGDLSHQEPSY